MFFPEQSHAMAFVAVVLLSIPTTISDFKSDNFCFITLGVVSLLL
jgi:hypothetical protein